MKIRIGKITQCCYEFEVAGAFHDILNNSYRYCIRERKLYEVNTNNQFILALFHKRLIKYVLRIHCVMGDCEFDEDLRYFAGMVCGMESASRGRIVKHH